MTKHEHVDFKLKQARYFMDQMRATDRDEDILRFNLSAFLSSARTIVQYIYEAAKRLGKNQWYKAQLKEHATLGYFKSERDDDIHQDPVLPGWTLSLKIFASNDEEEPYDSELKQHFYFGDDASKELFAACDEYLAELTHFIDEAARAGIIA